jgi:hypothetical protein
MKTTILKYAAAATLAGTLALAAATPGQARDGRNAAAAIGFGAGALVGAAVVGSQYNNGYYGPSYGYAPGYYAEPGYAYEPAPVYAAPYDSYGYAPTHRYRSWSGGRDDSIRSQR